MKIRISKAPPQNGLSVEGDKYKTLSSDGINLNGNYHESGGTMVSSNGQVVEAEKNEPIYTGSDGSNYVFGNVSNPFTGKLFKNEGKELLQQKGVAEKKLDKANQVVAGADPHSKFGSLDFNTGMVQMDAAQIDVTSLKSDLDNLAGIQENLLSFADAVGADPKKLGKDMKKNGGKIKVRMNSVPSDMYKADDGKRLSANPFLNNIFTGVGNPIPNFGPTPGSQLPPTPQQQVQVTSPVQVADVQPNGQGTLAQRNNNPGNLKFNNQVGAIQGDAGFAKFNSYEQGYQALLNDIKAKQTGKTKTKLGPNSSILDFMNVYSPSSNNNNPKALSQTLAKGLGVDPSTPIGGLDTKKLADLIAINEDSAYANSVGNTPKNDGTVTKATPISQAIPPTNPNLNEYGFLNYPKGQDPGVAPLNNLGVSDIQPLQTSQPLGQPIQNPNQLVGGQQFQNNQPKGPKKNVLTPLDYLGEISAILDRPDYVQGQQYNPTLMTPYRVSFEDQIAQGTASYNALAQNLTNNPEALATLQGQKYQQDQNILGNQFRANQGVQNQVLNQNNQILNQAQMTNIDLRQQQADRQTQAQAITDSNRQNALASISNKYSQNKLFNNERQAEFDSQQRQANLYGNLYQNYKFDDQGNVIFQDNGGYNFNMNGSPMNNQAAYYQYQAQQKQLKKQAEADAARKVATAAFGFKFL